MDFILDPLTLLSALAGSLVLFLVLFLSAQRARLAERRRHEAERQEMSESIKSLRGSLDHLRISLEDERGPANASPCFSVISGLSMNLNKRSEALRLRRRGQSPEHIAAALQLPRGEVDLLFKVQTVLAAETVSTRP